MKLKGIDKFVCLCNAVDRIVGLLEVENEVGTPPENSPAINEVLRYLRMVNLRFS